MNEAYSEIPISVLERNGFPTNWLLLSDDQRDLIKWFLNRTEELSLTVEGLEEQKEILEDQLTDLEYEQLEASLKKHIEIETIMIEESKTLLDKEEDGRVKRLLEEIYQDEIRHHKFLTNLLQAVLKKDLIFEKEIWDMIWRDVPTHGAPADPYI